MEKVCEYEGSSLWGMNGGQPESPDGTLLVYAKKPDLEDKEKQTTEIWICNRDTLSDARRVFTVSCGNHNGPSATFTDNDHIVFRDIINGFSAFRVLNIHTGEVVYGPIFGKESHCAENCQYPFSISEEFLDKNPDYPELNTCGIYLLDLTTGKIRRVADKKTVYDMVVKSGCTPNDHTTSMSHVQLNPSATKVMMRLSVANCPVFGALGCIDLETGKTHVIPDKPVHQLWFDDDTYMATRQYYDGSKIEMETSRIQRFTPDGECIETLGGIGNHIDGSPDRSYFVGDRAYPGYPADIFLYRRGETTPIATFGGQNFQNCTWKLQIHPNPTFSRNGKRIYFNHPVSENRTEACFVEIDELLKQQKGSSMERPKTTHYQFFCNRECEYFPCHKNADPDNFNCLFCYCPLYALGKKCGGQFRYLPNGNKDCSNCTFPHKRENYKAITSRYKEIAELIKEKN